MKFYFKKVKIAKIENKWGHRDLNPDPRISLVSVLQLVIILFLQSAHFLQRQLESQMIARLHYDPKEIIY